MCHLCLNSSHLVNGACGVVMWYMVEKSRQLYIMFISCLFGCTCSVVVWHVNKGEALCGSPAQVESAGITHCLAASQADRDVFVTAGK